MYIGSIVILIWGIAHIIPTKSLVSGFGEITEDNRRNIKMEWVGEGLTLVFIGGLVQAIILLSRSQNAVAANVLKAFAVMLIFMAIWTGITRARTSIVP